MVLSELACSFLLKVGNVLDFLQSLGSEFQILAPLYAKLFCPILLSFLGALDLDWNYEASMASKPKRLWVRKIISEREEHSQFYVLVRQPQVHDRESFFNYLRMTPNRFEHLLTLVASFIQKKKCRSRRPLSSAGRLVITLCCLATSA